MNIYLQLLDSVLAPRTAAYVCGPLETGRTFYELQAQGEATLAIRAENVRRMSEFASSLRERLTYPVIDPGILRVPGWSGADYGRFFLRVLERYGREAWLLDGWQFSRGATKEFVHCVRIGIPVLDEHGCQVSRENGRSLMNEALKDLRDLGIDVSWFVERLR